MASLSPEPNYTVFIRLPFPRGDFIDPPPANWEPSKDEALWSIISKLSKTEIDFTVDFLLQQVAWLTERHASQVRAQMRKAAAAAKVSPAPSPQPQGPEGLFSADPMRYAGIAIRPRAPSSTSIRKDSPLPRNEQNPQPSSARGTPLIPPTRISSTNTALLTMRNLGNGAKTFEKSGADTQPRRLTSLPITTNVDDQDDRDDRDQEPDPRSPDAADLSASSPSFLSSSSSSSSSPAQSRIIRRPPRFQSNEGPSFADDDDDDEPAFLPYRTHAVGTTSGHHDLSATLRGNLGDPGKRPFKGSDRNRFHHSQTSDSSTSSFPVSTSGHGRRSNGPLSPRRTMELAGRSPGSRSKGYSRDSDGTPSMGSSFSDLDDTSVTQSALEEALASRMQDGGTISSLRGTMGTISNVFRSRYQARPSNNAS
ncbi:hypothetical protein GGR50DRAFT_690237 [Xylaria sp. CBS 124048]|nr:hypothetical protein GGR50DRAFT_690237 [Xylaria sp. CBS 124048]